jgi:PAS domain S-box-containing protein
MSSRKVPPPPLQPGPRTAAPTASRVLDVALCALFIAGVVAAGVAAYRAGAAAQPEVVARSGVRVDGALLAAVALIAAAGAALALRLRSRGEAARREREALERRVEVLSRWANDMVLLLDQELHIVEANSRAEELLGHGREELCRLGLRDLVAPAFVGGLDAHVAVQLERGWEHWETRFRRRDGTEFPVEVTVKVEQVDGRPWLHMVVRDITARQWAEDALRASETRFRAAFDGVGLGMMLLDRHGAIVESNLALQRMLDRDAADLRGRSPLELVHPDDVTTAVAFRDQMQAVGRGQHDFACRHLRRDGTAVETQVRVCSLGGPADQLDHALALVEDVSDKLRLEAQLRLADRMASMGTLAAGMAHEINNPLAFVLANLEFAIRELRRDGTDQDVVAALEEAREGGTRVREIVRDLKTFSRADDATSAPIDPGRVLRSALSVAGSELRSRARLHTAISHTPKVMGSEHRLGQVLLNLLINAAQAIPEGRVEAYTIRASTGVAPDGRVQVEIADDGVGIPPEIRPRIFDPFFTTKPVGVGTGLGLSICHGIVVAMGGEITVDSAPERGTTFRVLLPAAPVEEVAPPAPPTSAPSRRARVLVVDDEPLVGRAVQRILSPPHDVRVQASGQAALAAIEAEDGWDLVLCDLMMPDLSGMDLHGLVVARRPELAARFVFLTGGAFTGGAQEFLRRVPNERLEKPFEPTALRALVARVLEAGKAGGAA